MSAIFFNDNIKEKAILLPNCSRFAPHGQSYYLSCDDLEGFYWTYDTEYFRVSICDFDFKKRPFIVATCHVFLILHFFQLILFQQMVRFYHPINNYQATIVL